jgi:flagellar hook-length control protein FliK
MFELNSLLSGSGKSPETGVNGGMKDNSNSEKSPFGAILEANIADQEMAKSGNDAEQSGKEMPAFDYRTDLEKRTLSGGAELFLGGVEPSEEVIMDYARTQGLDAELVEILMAKSAVNKAEVVEDADTILDDLSSSGSPNTAPSSDLLSGSLSNISQNKSSLINDHSYLEVESPVTDKTKLGVSNQLGVKREDGVLTRLDTLAQKVSPDDNPEKMPLTQGNRRSAGDILTSKQNDFTANIPEELVEKLTTASSLRMHGAALVNSSSQMPSALLGENALPAKLNRAIAYTDLPSVKPQSSPVTAKNTVESTEITPLSKEIEGTSSQNNASTQESPSSRVVKSEAVSVAVKNPVETAEAKTPSKVAEVASPERSVSIKEGATSRVAKDDIAPTKSVAKLGSIPVTAKNSVETTEIKTPSKAVEVISPERTVSSQESASSRVVKSEPVPVAVKSPVETAETKAPSKAVEVASPERTVSSQESPSSRVVKSEPVSVAVKSPVETAETKAPSKAVEVASPERTVSSQESPSSRVVKSEAVSVAVKNPVETAETKTPSKVAEVASPERSVSIKEGATSRVAKGDIAPTKSVAKLGSIPVTAKNSVETTEIKTPSKAVEVISPERTVSSQESPSSRVVKSEPVSVAVKSPVETAETKAPSKAVEVASPERSASPQKTAVSRAVKEVPFGLDAQNKGNINSATVKARELDRAMPVSVSTLKPETTEVKPPEIKPEMRTQSDKGIDTSHKVPVGPRSVDKQTALEANANRPVPEVIRVAMPISVAKNMTSAETKNTRVIKLAPIDLAAFANTVEKVSLPYKRSSVIEENNFTKERSSEATALGTNGRVSLSEKGTTEQILNSSGQDNLRRQDQYLELSQRLTDALSRRLAAQIKQGSWHVEIELHPRSLGRIEVQLEMKNGELEAHFNASRALTRDLIQEGLPRLKAELEQHGTESAYVGVGHQNQGRSDENPTDSDGDSNSSGHETDSKADQNTKNQKVNNIEGLDIQV